MSDSLLEQSKHDDDDDDCLDTTTTTTNQSSNYSSNDSSSSFVVRRSQQQLSSTKSSTTNNKHNQQINFDRSETQGDERTLTFNKNIINFKLKNRFQTFHSFVSLQRLFTLTPTTQTRR